MKKEYKKNLVSVIVPMYNVSQIIKETIQSLKNQAYPNVEYLLINDGSSDNTLDRVTQLTNKDKRFKVFSKTNGGAASARNLGLKKSQGEYILFVDSDDILKTNAISKMYKTIKKTDTDMVIGAAKKFGQEKEWYINMHVNKNIYTPGTKTILKNPELFYAIALWGKLFKRELVRSVKVPSHLVFAEDQIITFHAYLHAKKIAVVEEVVYYYRVRETMDSLTQSISDNAVRYSNNLFEILAITNEIHKKLPNYTDYEKKILYCKYLERFFSFEFFKVFFWALQKKEHQKAVLQHLLQWLENTSVFVISNTPAVRYFVLIELKKYICHIKKRNYQILAAIFQEVIRKMDDKAWTAFKKNWENEFADTQQLINKISSNQCSISHMMLSFANHFQRKYQVKEELFNGMYNTSSRLPMNRKKVIFASTKVNQLHINSNLYFIYKALDFSGFNRKLLLGSPKRWYKEIWKYYHLATAHFIFVDDYYFPLYGKKIRQKTEYIQTWHGAGALKKFAFSARNKKDANTLEFENKAHGNYTKVLCSSEFVRTIFGEAFRVDIGKTISIFPRLDYFENVDQLEVKAKFANLYPAYADKQKVLFAPTFRGDPLHRKEYELTFDWQKLRDFHPDTIFLIKFHPVVERWNKIPEDLKQRVVILNHENINELMIWCDIFVTDYSSTIFEYALLDKPIIHYFAGSEEYAEERGLFLPAKNYVYGKKATTFAELLEAIENVGEWSHAPIFLQLKNDFKKRFLTIRENNTQALLEHLGMKKNRAYVYHIRKDSIVEPPNTKFISRL